MLMRGKQWHAVGPNANQMLLFDFRAFKKLSPGFYRVCATMAWSEISLGTA
jgi:hypothetical protein